MKLYFFRSAKEKEAAQAKRRMLENKYKKPNPDVAVVKSIKEADYIVACGGDGTFLELEQLMAHRPDLSAKLVGVACGTVNHLMNNVDDLVGFIRTADTIVHHPMRVTCVTEDGRYISRLGTNDATIHRSSNRNQACNLSVRIGCGPSQIRGEIHGDGMVAASRQGASAYYRNAGGKFIDVWSASYGTQPICDINAANLSRIVPEDTRIVIDVKDYRKRPVSVFVDNLSAINNVVRCEIQMEQHINIPVLVNRQTPFVKFNQKMAQQKVNTR